MYGKMFTVLVLLVLCNAKEFLAAGLNCGGTYTDKEVTIKFPNYNNDSLENTVCHFSFKDDQCSTQYFFNFEYFDLTESDKCDSTGLEIEEQDVLCGKQTGTKIYYSQNGILNVKFYSRLLRRNDRFKILVSKIPCETSDINRHVKRSIFHQTCKSYEIPLQLNSEQYKSPWNYYHNPIHYPLITQQNSDQKFCCATKYNSKHFMIASPNFMYSKSNPVNCVYHIYRANSNICKIRFNFLFFSNGYQTTQGCQNGYLEIDGKHICGCKTELKLSSIFDNGYGSFPKVLKFKSEGYPSEKLSGFAIEVLQDECLNKHQSYHIGVARVKRASLKRDRRWVFSDSSAPAYVAPYTPHYSHQQALNNPSGSYMDITAFNPFAHFDWNDHKCTEWDSTQLTKNKLWRNMPQCSNGKPSTKCYEVREKSGCLKTPGYPFYYPNNLNLCYRFVRSPGYCALKLIMLDFLIEDSYLCTKDYVLLGSTRFCGTKLYNTFSVLTYANGTFEDVVFISDGSISCRGFRAWFVQLPCKDITTQPTVTTQSSTSTITSEITTITSTITTPTTTTPITTTPTTTTPTTATPTTMTPTTTTPTTTTPTTTTPTTTTPTTTTPTTTMPTTVTTTIPTTTMSTITTSMTTIPITTTTETPRQCFMEFREERFQINYSVSEDLSCSFTVFKFHPDACAVTLTFTNFELPCSAGYLLIENRQYCDLNNPLYGEWGFITDTFSILYYNFNDSNTFNGRIVIDGRQLTECTPEPEFVPEEVKEPPEKQYEEEVQENNNQYDIIIRNLNHNMCGLQINVTYYITAPDDTNMCNLLKHYNRRQECIPLYNHVMYAPYFNNTIELTVESREVYDSMHYKEVRCGEDSGLLASHGVVRSFDT